VLDFSKLKQPFKRASSDAPIEPELPPLEQLFQDVQARIHQEIYHISIEPKRGPSCRLEDLQLHYGRHYGLLSLHQEMAEKLDLLEPEYDTLDLRQQMTYVEQYLDYVKAMVDCSYELIHFKEALAQAGAAIIKLDQDMHQTHSKDEFKSLEAGLEQILDLQDQLSRQYEDFVFRGLDPITISSDYQAYLKKINSLQDALDETRNWLG